MITRFLLSSLALAALMLAGGQGANGKETESVVSFGTLESAKPEAARAQAEAWLKQVGKNDPATLKQLATIWSQEDRTVLDRVADSLVLGSPEAAKLLAQVRDPQSPAPVEVPAILKDAKQPLFLRANLALVFARNLANRKVFDEALETLKLFRPEQVVDPASYLFHRAVCEHSQSMRPEATRTLNRLLEDGAAAAPKRYKTVAMLMLVDIQTWKDKDLAAVARKMSAIKDRLEIARGGPKTIKLEKEVLNRLDEMIKELENKAKKGGGGGGGGGGDPNGGGCPNGGQPGSGSQGGAQPTSPMQTSQIALNGGKGTVDPVKMRKLVANWGKLPPRERNQALQELTRGMSPRHREGIENYFRNLTQGQKR